jgi:DNA polymerase III gamma/tau subunit
LKPSPQAKAAELMEQLNLLLNAGHSPSSLARQMVRYLRNALMAKLGGEQTELLQISGDERARAARTALLFTEEELTRNLQIVLRTFDDLNYRQEQRFHPRTRPAQAHPRPAPASARRAPQRRKKMLSLTVNPAAEKIIRQELQRLGGPARFMVVPGEGAGAATPVPAAPIAGSIQEAALNNPLVQRAREIFNAEIRSVVDLRTK